MRCPGPPEEEEEPAGGHGEEEEVEVVEEPEQREEEVMERSSGSEDGDKEGRRGGDESERGRESEGEVSATASDDAGRGDAGDRADSTPRTRDDERRRLWSGQSAQQSAPGAASGGGGVDGGVPSGIRVLKLRRVAQLRRMGKPLEALLLSQQHEGADVDDDQRRLLDLHALVEQGLCYRELQRPGESETCFNSALSQCEAMLAGAAGADRAADGGEDGDSGRDAPAASDDDERDRSSCGGAAGRATGARVCLSGLRASALAGLAWLRRDGGQLAEAASLLSHARSARGADGGDLDCAPAGAGARLEAPVGAAEVCAQAAGVLSDLGTTLKMAGSLDEAMAKYTEAIAADRTHAPSFYNAGVLYGEMGRDEQAMRMYESAVRARPLYPEAICNMGVIHKSRGRLQDALRCYERCLSVAPNFTLAKCNAAIALCELAAQLKAEGSFVDAVRTYEKALSLHPQYAEGYYNFAVALGEAGKTDAAIIMYESALRCNPRCAEALNNLGVIYKELGNFDKAVECYLAALKIRPEFAQPMNNLGVIYTCQGRFSEALRVLKCATGAAPWYSEAYNNLGVLYRDVGMIEEAIEAYDRCLSIDPAARNAGQNRLLALNYIYSGRERVVSDAHREWGRRFGSLQGAAVGEAGEAPPARAGRGAGPLVVGYISPDFFVHSVSYFIEAPLRCHDPARVRVVVYSATARQDGKTAMFRSLAEEKGWLWRDVQGSSEEDIARAVRADGVDVLVELTGHTANNRLGVLCHRAAPVQVTWIGYPNSTGLEQCDFRITDAIADPLETEQSYAERLYRLPQCFLCYTPTSEAEAGAVDSLPALRNGYVTFGSFNNLAKMTPGVFRLWARVLAAVPNSNLLIKGKSLACPSVVARVQQHFIENGVSPARIDTMPLTPLTGSHLQVYSSSVDVSIDTFPYGGTTTTCESMYMGVPCITLRGDCHAQNVGASLLSAVGLDDWIASTEDDYVEIARSAASDLAALAALRAGLRERLLTSPLCNGAEFVESLEDAYEDMYDLRAAGGRATGARAEGGAAVDAPAPAGR